MNSKKGKDGRDAEEIIAAIASWPDADACKVGEEIKECLESVTHLTEYQDDKASRILTGMAFVGALGATVHALALQFVFSQPGVLQNCFNFALWLFYLGAVVGSLIAIYAIKPRFALPKQRARPFSLRFGPEIARFSGAAWANEFVGKSVDDLRALNAKDQVTEIKLIANKIKYKIKYLNRAVWCYLFSLTALTVGILTLGGEYVKKAQKQAQVVMVFDADNTLWDTNALYAKAQEAVVTGLEKISGGMVEGDKVTYLRGFDEQIAKNHEMGFRYPINLLIERLYVELSGGKDIRGVSPETRNALDRIESEYLSTVQSEPRLFPRAKEVLAALNDKGYRLILLSESDPKLLDDRLDRKGIREFFYDVVAARKTTDVFNRLKRNYAASSRTVFVSIGDRIDVDLQLADKAGYRTIQVPGAFRPFSETMGCWKPDEKVLSLAEIPAAIEAFR